MPNADVFISYRRDQREQVLVIAEKLQELGLSVWFDARLEAGTSFDEEINREVRSAKAVFVCWSPEAVQSRWVRAEASIGLERDVLVAAFLTPTELMPPYNLVHAADLQGWRGEQNASAWLDLLTRIGRLTGKSDLADRARAKALDAQWAEKDAVARAEFAAKVEEARKRFAALHESRPAAFAQALEDLKITFESWLLRRRTMNVGAAPNPLALVEDEAAALRTELEIAQRERAAALAAAERLRAAQSQTPASDERSGASRTIEPKTTGQALLHGVAVLLAGPFALIGQGRRLLAIAYLALFSIVVWSGVAFAQSAAPPAAPAAPAAPAVYPLPECYNSQLGQWETIDGEFAETPRDQYQYRYDSKWSCSSIRDARALEDSKKAALLAEARAKARYFGASDVKSFALERVGIGFLALNLLFGAFVAGAGFVRLAGRAKDKGASSPPGV
jgi:hypothetical protein